MSPLRTCGWSLLVAGLALACNDDARLDSSAAAADAPHAADALLTIVTTEPAGSTCPLGGERIAVGLDEDASASLEPWEVHTTTVLCNGGSATSPVARCPTRATLGRPPQEASWHRELALVGAGFIALRSGGGSGATYYARKATFQLDNLGCFAAGSQLRLLGYRSSADGSLGTKLEDVCIAPAALPTTVTSRVHLAVNLNANSTVPLDAWDSASPAATSNFPSSVVVYDSLGNGHQVTVYFRKLDVSRWEWFAVVDGAEVSGGLNGIPNEGANGTLTFTDDGALASESQAHSNWSFVGATPNQAIDFDFGTSIDGEHGQGFDGTTDFAAPSTTNAADQNGYAAGVLKDLSISDTGAISGTFTNGAHQPLGQIPIVSFPNADELAHACDELWVATPASGAAVPGSPGTLGRGSFLPVVL